LRQNCIDSTPKRTMLLIHQKVKF